MAVLCRNQRLGGAHPLPNQYSILAATTSTMAMQPKYTFGIYIGLSQMQSTLFYIC